MVKSKKPPITTLPKNELETIGEAKEVATTEINTIKIACQKAGIGIDDYVRAIKAALLATKTAIDKYGEEHIEDDHAMRLKAALMGLELEGYIKNKITSNTTATHNTVIYKWGDVMVANAIGKDNAR